MEYILNVHETRKKATNLSLDQNLLEEAKSLGINLSAVAEPGLKNEILRIKSEQWK